MSENKKILTQKDNQEIEKAILFIVNKITEHCSNEKPLILHSLRVGFKLMELGEKKEVVISGLLHDLLEDTNCKKEEIEKEFGNEVTKLVLACTFDKDIKDYKERWRVSLANINKAGRQAFIIKLMDQMDNLPYYILILDKIKKEQLIWKHKYFIECFDREYSDFELFCKYKESINKISSI